MYCRRCGRQVAEGNKFCQYCGMPIDGANADQSQQSQNTQNQQNYQYQQQSYQYQQPNYQNYQGYQNGYQYNNPYPQPIPGKGYGIASLVLGICSIPLYVSPVLGLIVGIIGLCLGISSSKSAKSVGLSNGVATAGIACSAVGLAISGFIILWALTILGAIGSLLF